MLKISIPLIFLTFTIRCIFLRRGEETSDREINKKFFLEFHKNLKGEIMFINDEPLAIQLILAVKSKAGFFV